MGLIPLADKGNFFHIYDFRVKPGTGKEFVKNSRNLIIQIAIQCTNRRTK